MAASDPESYFINKPTVHVPNSPLPVLVYRTIVPPPVTAESISSLIEAHSWLQGGIFKTYTAHHYHSVTHECYAVFKGSSRLLLGKGPLDEDAEGVEVVLGPGDAIVLPAGVSHCSVTSDENYEYVGLYPKGSPKWDNNFCKADAVETREKAENCRSVPIPDHDPVFGAKGPLVDIWTKAAAAATA